MCCGSNERLRGLLWVVPVPAQGTGTVTGSLLAHNFPAGLDSIRRESEAASSWGTGAASSGVYGCPAKRDISTTPRTAAG